MSHTNSKNKIPKRNKTSQTISRKISWDIIASNGEIIITCYCGIYYDLEYINLQKLRNHIQAFESIPNKEIRFTLSKRYPCLIGRGPVPSKEIIELIIAKNFKSFKYPSTNRHPPTIEHQKRTWKDI